MHTSAVFHLRYERHQVRPEGSYTTDGVEGRAGPTRAASVVSRRYINIPEAAEYLRISTKFVRALIMEGEIKGYWIGSYARHRTLRVDLDDRINRLLRGWLTARCGNRFGNKRRETPSNQCDTMEPARHPTTVDLRF